MPVKVWDKRWKNKQDKYILNLNPYGELFLEILLKYIPRKKRLKILEVGCGSGRFLYHLKKYSDQKKLNWIIKGCDISRESVKLASKYLKNICLKSYTQLKEPFDVIFENGTIEHFNEKDYKKFIKWAYPRLNKKGILIITNTNKNSIHYYHWKLLGKHYEYGFTNLRSTEDMRNELKKLKKFRIIASFSYGYMHNITRYFGKIGKLVEKVLRPVEYTKRALKRGFMNVCIAQK